MNNIINFFRKYLWTVFTVDGTCDIYCFAFKSNVSFKWGYFKIRELFVSKT